MSSIAPERNPDAEALLPPAQLDGSGIGVNYVDAFLKGLAPATADGRAVSAKRKGLKITLTIGEARGEALLRRLEHGPEPRDILRHALQAAAEDAGGRLALEDGNLVLEI